VSEIGVIYTTRGADQTFRQRLLRFIDSYLCHQAGIDHKLYVIYKEFDDPEDVLWAKEKLYLLKPIHIEEYNGFNSNGGAGIFLDASKHVAEPLICCLNTSSEIMHDNWLKILHLAYIQPTVGLVGCSGSYGFITEIFQGSCYYPNVHIRGTAFLIHKEHYQAVTSGFDFSKRDLILSTGVSINRDYFDWEFGPRSMTRQIMNMGKTVLVAEKDRIIAPHQWGDTTYRGNLHNLLINDRGSRDFQDL
jgi:hypothetical protein